MMTLSQSKAGVTGYHHEQWRLKRRFLRFLIRTIALTLLIKLDGVEGLENIPDSGPALIFINHIAFVDPIIAIHVTPRDLVPMAKIEVYEYPVIGIFPKLWGVIPVRREEFDRRAVQQAIEILRAGELVLVAPEGTRREALFRGKEGVAYIATKCDVPVVPMAIRDSVGFPAFRTAARWRGPAAQVKIGKPFRFRKGAGRPDRQELRQMTDESMYILASLLPENLRGVYSDLSQATQDTIEWLS
jgi:1-acyl-sn-glycerol-3-phosphate acyltransferase